MRWMSARAVVSVRVCGDWLRRHNHTLTDSSFRTVTLLAVLTVLNVFDLAFTQSQLSRGNFAEANTLAVQVAQCSPLGMVGYKAVLFLFAAGILYRLRHHRASQAGLWLMTACYAGLMFWWSAYLDAVEICLSNPATMTCFPAY